MDSDLVTRILKDVREGRQDSAEKLFPLVYEELRGLARARMRAERDNHTLQPTALVHEAWMRLLGTDGDPLDWQNRRTFFAAAAQAMRRLLVEHARQRNSQKRGGEFRRLVIDGMENLGDDDQELDLVALDEALDRLGKRDERAALVVQLRFFAGLNVEETAAAMEMSPRTVKREWTVARAWLAKELAGG